MGTKITTLIAKTSGDSVYPNILPQNIPGNAIDTSKLASLAVTEAKIASGAVTNAKIASGAVTNAKIADSSISKSKMQDDSVGTDQIEDVAITKNKIKNNNVNALKLIRREEYVTDVCGEMGIVDFAGFKDFIENYLSGEPAYMYKAMFNYVTGNGGIIPTFFWVTDTGKVRYARIDDLSNPVEVSNDSDFTAFLAGDGDKILAVYIEE